MSENKNESWWKPHLGNEWWEKSVEEDFLVRANNKSDEYIDQSAHEYMRVKKIEEFMNEKIILRDQISQTSNLHLTLKEANGHILDELLNLACKEESLVFKNVSNLFDRHFAEKKLQEE